MPAYTHRVDWTLAGIVFVAAAIIAGPIALLAAASPIIGAAVIALALTAAVWIDPRA